MADFKAERVSSLQGACRGLLAVLRQRQNRAEVLDWQEQKGDHSSGDQVNEFALVTVTPGGSAAVLLCGLGSGLL